MTLVKDNITYTPEYIPANINIQKTKLQITKIHLSNVTGERATQIT